MSEQDNFDALFNPKVDMGDMTAKSTEEYKVGADQGKNGVYQSVIRFIPWYKNPSKSITEKWVSWLEDPVTGKGRFVDCPSSVGEKSPLQDMFWKFKKSDSIQEQKKADIFSRRHNFASLVQVIKDDNQPELEGKILVYRFGKKLWEKINAEMKPVIGDPHNPFDPLSGKVFGLVITKVSGFNNYDQSKFIDKVVPIAIPDENGKLKFIDANSDKQMVYNFLKENSPDLDKYGYKPWDQETRDYVDGIIMTVTGKAIPSNNMSDIRNTVVNPGNPVDTKTGTNSGSGIQSEDINLDDVDTSSISSGLGDLDNLGGLDDAFNDTSSDLGDLDDVLKDL